MTPAALFHFGPSGWTTFDTTLVVCTNVLLASALVWWKVSRATRSLQEAIDDFKQAWRSQHRQATQVGTLRGLITALELGLEEGGLDAQLRRKIYRACDEAFRLIDEERDSQGQLDRQLVASTIAGHDDR